jgi:hypothetical protein
MASAEVDGVEEIRQMLIVSKPMIELYQMFGDMVCLDAHYLVNMDNILQDPRLTMAVLVGMDANCQLVLFGFGLILGKTAENYEWLLRTLFSLMEKTPTSLFTDFSSDIV